MHKLKKIKKRKLLFIFLLLLLFYVFFHSKNYEKEYFIGDTKVIEKFNKKESVYEFYFYTKEKEFFAAFSHKYFLSKKLVKEVEIKEKDNNFCIIPKSNKINFYPLCLQNDRLISYHLINNEELDFSSFKKEIEFRENSFNSITMYNLNNKKYYIWNYDGFLILSDKEQKKVKLFQEDVYNIPLTIKVGNKLLIANYDSKYEFNTLYILDSKKDKAREMNLGKMISFDSYFLGATNKKAYLVDKKNKKEYEIDPKKLKLKSIVADNQGKIIKNSLWESISINSLVNNEDKFTYQRITNFKIENDILYKVENGYQTKLSEKKVKDIIYQDQNTIYYLVEDKLYYYNDDSGEILALSNFEWNFNYKNLIYIF